MKNYFSNSEIKCKCCNLIIKNDRLLSMLNIARDIAKMPFIINSWCRCSANNELAGGSPTSSHLKGLAVDIRCKNSRDRGAIVKALYGAGFNRLGGGEAFVHTDIDTSKTKDVFWLYKK